MNDPNAPIFHKGEYHLFFQYNPYGKEWGNIHWGHCKSADLIHWEELGIALYPSAEQREVHCFSGCSFVKDDTVYIFYTCIGRNDGSVGKGAEQWLVTSKDLSNFEKYAQNPVMGMELHRGLLLPIRDWRDPFVWQEEDGYHMALAGASGSTGHILHYRSANLYDWVFDRILFSKVNDTLECPAVIKKGKEYLLIYSSTAHFQVEYVICDETFSPRLAGRIDGSSYCYYAATVSKGGDGRHLLWGWRIEDKDKADKPWVGIQSFPREISFDESGVLMKPAVDLMQNHASFLEFPGGDHGSTQAKLTNPHFALALEMEASGKELELQLSFSNHEHLKIQICMTEKWLRIGSQPEQTLTFETPRNVFSMIWLMDGSAAEIFVNGRYCLSACVYPRYLDDLTLTVTQIGNFRWKALSLAEWEEANKKN